MTSTLQQEGGRKLRLSAQQVMRVAQGLYERGYITYMRTDSTALSDTAIAAARSQVTSLFGQEYLSPGPRRWEGKVKNAQEAHEAIRPAGDTFRTPAQVRPELNDLERRLYELIWMRTLASQMADARGKTVTLRVGARSSDGRDAEFGAAGTTITFAGYRRAYVEGIDEDTVTVPGDDERILPALTVGDTVPLGDLEANGHSTTAPARYT
jgi:DNA topoisomerase-1